MEPIKTNGAGKNPQVSHPSGAAIQNGTHATSNGPGQALALNFGEGATKHLMWFMGSLFLGSIFIAGLALNSAGDAKVSAADAKAAAAIAQERADTAKGDANRASAQSELRTYQFNLLRNCLSTRQCDIEKVMAQLNKEK